MRSVNFARVTFIVRGQNRSGAGESLQKFLHLPVVHPRKVFQFSCQKVLPFLYIINAYFQEDNGGTGNRITIQLHTRTIVTLSVMCKPLPCAFTLSVLHVDCCYDTADEKPLFAASDRHMCRFQLWRHYPLPQYDGKILPDPDGE